MRKNLTYEQKKEVENLIKQGMRYDFIAQKYGINSGTVSSFAVKSLGIRKQKEKRTVQKTDDTGLLLHKLGEISGILQLIHTELVKIRNPQTNMIEE